MNPPYERRGPGDRDGGPGGGPRRERRMPPQDATGREAAWLAEIKESRRPVAVHLVDGEVVRGVVEYYDRDVVKINRETGPNVFVRKAHIRYVHEEG